MTEQKPPAHRQPGAKLHIREGEAVVLSTPEGEVLVRHGGKAKRGGRGATGGGGASPGGAGEPGPLLDPFPPPRAKTLRGGNRRPRPDD